MNWWVLIAEISWMLVAATAHYSAHRSRKTVRELQGENVKLRILIDLHEQIEALNEQQAAASQEPSAIELEYVYRSIGLASLSESVSD